METAQRPDRAGQAVKSTLDGTIGITASGIAGGDYIDVMFLGSIGRVAFKTFELTVIDIQEAS